MKTARQLLFWCHLGTGLFAALVVIVMSVTGTLLTYQKQMTAWADRRAAHVEVPQSGTSRLSIESLLRNAQQQTNAEPTAITVRSRPDAPVEVQFGRDRRSFYNPYTGAELGAGGTSMREFFRVVTAWHRTLGATGEHRALGRSITGAANLAFLFLVVSGAFLWWPRNLTWRSVRNVLVFRRSLSGKARDFNWHNVLGIWSVVPLVVIVASGVVISYRWAGDLVYRAAGEAPPATASGNTSSANDSVARTTNGLDAAFSVAMARESQWTTLTAQLPRENAKTVSVTVDRGTGGEPHLRTTMVANIANGEVEKWDDFASLPKARRWRSILRFAHTGEVLGLTGQTVAGIVSFAAVVLAYTGAALSWRRFRAWQSRPPTVGRPIVTRATARRRGAVREFDDDAPSRGQPAA